MFLDIKECTYLEVFLPPGKRNHLQLIRFEEIKISCRQDPFVR